MPRTKEIQEQRVRQYFIDATKDILKGEGLKAVNVRAVAERAGYSYATLYNYFTDLNELIFICVNDFSNECRDFVAEQSHQSNAGSERIKAKAKAFINYFTQYPGIFELFYLERFAGTGSKQPTAQLIYTLFDSVIEQDDIALLNSGRDNDPAGLVLILTLKNTIAGLLLFYLNRLNPASYTEFIALTDRQLDNILQIQQH